MKAIFEVFEKCGKEFEGTYTAREEANERANQSYMGSVQQSLVTDEEYQRLIDDGEMYEREECQE